VRVEVGSSLLRYDEMQISMKVPVFQRSSLLQSPGNPRRPESSMIYLYLCMNFEKFINVLDIVNFELLATDKVNIFRIYR